MTEVINQNNPFLENLEKEIKEPYEGKHSVEQATNFNSELYNCLYCKYNNNNNKGYQYFSINREQIKQQEEDLESLQKSYKEETLEQYRNKLNDYLIKYVYSVRKWENFNESEVKHGIDHNMRVSYFVENILKYYNNNDIKDIKNNQSIEIINNEFKKDAITFAVMHDITHRGSPDFTDAESAIQFREFIKFISKNKDKEYDQKILAEKDEVLEKEEKKEDKKSNILASLISLGDCVEYIRYGNIDDRIKQRIERIINLTNINKEYIDKEIEKSKSLSIETDKQRYIDDDNPNGRHNLSQSQLKEVLDLKLFEIPNSKTTVEGFSKILKYNFFAKPLTNEQTEKSYGLIKLLRQENLGYLIDDLNSEKFKEKDNEKEINKKEMEERIKRRIENYVSEKTKKIINSIENIEIKDIKSINDINNNKTINKLFNEIAKKAIEQEIKFQLGRVEKRLNPFIDNLELEEENKQEKQKQIVENKEQQQIIIENKNKDQIDIKKQLKKNIEENIKIIFDSNETDFNKKFEAKTKLANTLRYIKTVYKKDKEYTNAYLMLNLICNSKNEEELKENINYILYHGTMRILYIKRNEKGKEDNKGEDTIIKTYSKETFGQGNYNEKYEEKEYIDMNIFRGISIENPDEFDIEKAFKKSGLLEAKLFDYYTEYTGSSTDGDLKIGNANTRGNITSYAIDSKISTNNYSGQNGFLFVYKFSKDQYENNFGLVANKSNTDNEVNTQDAEISNVALALKFKNGLVSDVIFNENFDGEFYIKENNETKLISKKELKDKILSFYDKTVLSNFLNNNLVIEKLLEKNIQEKDKEVIKKENKTTEEKIKEKEEITNTTEVKENLEDKITKKLKQICFKKLENKEEFKFYNKLLSNYYKYLSEKQNKKYSNENFEDFINEIIQNCNSKNKKDDSFKEKQEELNKFLAKFYCNSERYCYKILKNEELYNSLTDEEKEKLKDNILKRDNIFELLDLLKFRINDNSEIEEVIKKICENKSLEINALLIRVFDIFVSNEKKNEFINYQCLIDLLNNKDIKIKTLTYIFEKISNNVNDISNYKSILECIIRHKNCDSSVFEKIINKLFEEKSKKNIIEINNDEKSILECIIESNKCSPLVLKKIIEKFTTVNDLIETKIKINGNEKSILEHIIGHEKCDLGVLRKIFEKFTTVNDLIETKIKINGNEKSILEYIIESNKCSPLVLKKIIEKFTTVNDLIETKIKINGNEKSILEFIIKYQKCNPYVLETIIEKFTTVNDFIETKIKINGNEKSILECIIEHKECDLYVLKKIIEKFTTVNDLIETKITVNGKINSILEHIIGHEKCDSDVLETIINKFSSIDKLIKTKIKINNNEKSILECIIEHKECDLYVLKKIINKFSIKELTETKIKINDNEKSILEHIIGHEKCDLYVLMTIVDKFETYLEKVNNQIPTNDYRSNDDINKKVDSIVNPLRERAKKIENFNKRVNTFDKLIRQYFTLNQQTNNKEQLIN